MIVTFQKEFSDSKVAYTEELSDTINADYDKNDNVIGLELIGDLKKEMFDKMEFKILD